MGSLYFLMLAYASSCTQWAKKRISLLHGIGTDPDFFNFRNSEIQSLYNYGFWGGFTVLPAFVSFKEPRIDSKKSILLGYKAT